MNINTRFYVESVTSVGQPGYGAAPPAKTCEKIVMRAVYSSAPDDPNRSYSEATPSATVEMLVSNKDAWGAFAPGCSYDVVFSPTPATTAGNTP